MAERLGRINIDFDRLIIDRAFEHIFSGGLEEGARASVAFEALNGVEQISRDQRRIAAQACADWHNRDWSPRRFLEGLDQAVDEAHRNARHASRMRAPAAVSGKAAIPAFRELARPVR